MKERSDRMLGFLVGAWGMLLASSVAIQLGYIPRVGYIMIGYTAFGLLANAYEWHRRWKAEKSSDAC